MTTYTLKKKPPKPPADLAAAGKALWKSIVEDYGVDDPGGLALLTSVCRTEDAIVRMLATVAADGDTCKTDPSKPHPLLAAIRGSEGVKRQGLAALHLDVEPKQSGPGRPTGR
ncbi:MAG TPA: hypothetical protein VFY29_07215 [Terriglobia bacterium]|nr:hypothetical protein [Terriglobia bacterium]